MRFRAIIEQDEDGVFVSHCPTLPGCWSQGDTREEALRNLADAVQGYLASLKEHGDMPGRVSLCTIRAAAQLPLNPPTV